LAYVQERLKKLGVDKALAKAGAVEGSPVHIGKFSFEFIPD
ncbi:MAG: Obg family GTPase CgtA, partial [Acidimicrobiales bacterium]|nr:Obg family GTPase CgtA [Acidimicrobiales bacterium]